MLLIFLVKEQGTPHDFFRYVASSTDENYDDDDGNNCTTSFYSTSNKLRNGTQIILIQCRDHHLVKQRQCLENSNRATRSAMLIRILVKFQGDLHLAHEELRHSKL